MRTSVLLAISIAGFGFALWLACGGEPPAPVSVAGKTVPTVTATATSAPIAFPTSHPLAPSAQPSSRPAPASSIRAAIAFAIASTSRSRSASTTSRRAATRAGCSAISVLDSTYRLHVKDGAVTIGDIKTTESTINDPQLERCIKDKIATQTWRDEELPDMEEEDDLFMRAAGWEPIPRTPKTRQLGG